MFLFCPFDLMKDGSKKTDKTLRLGVVGCGRVFERYHLPAIKRSPDWKLVAVCEPSKERRKWIEDSFRTLSTFDTILKFHQNSSLDAVLITTPPDTHCHLTIKSLESGMHVLVEKPMALNPTEGKLMLEASLRFQKHLWVGFNRRFRRPYLNLRDKLATIPKESIQKINFELISDIANWNSITHYLGDDTKGGGILDDTASHQLDLLSWLLDERVIEVKAETLATNGDILKCVKYKLKFENGLVANCMAGHGPGYLENLQIQLNDRKLVAYPSGVLEFRSLPTSWIRGYCQLKTASHLIFRKLIQKPNVTLQSFEKQFSSFAAAIRHKKGYLSGADAKSGFGSIKALQACRESLQSGGNWKSLTSQAESIS